MTERLEYLDLNAVAKFLSKSVSAIWYRDTFLTEEFNDWLITFDEGRTREGEDVISYSEGQDFFDGKNRLGLGNSGHFVFLIEANEDNFEMLRDVWETCLEDDVLHEIIPTALELTWTMNNEKEAA